MWSFGGNSAGKEKRSSSDAEKSEKYLGRYQEGKNEV